MLLYQVINQKSLYLSMSFIFGFIRILCIGMLNIKPSSVVLKDPLTGINDIIKDGLNLTRDKNKGVWIRKRPLNNCLHLGFASLFFENFGLNYLHYCFRIEGKTYQLKGNGRINTSGKKDMQGSIIIDQIPDEELQKFQWYYKGPAKIDEGVVSQLIEKFNNQEQKYCAFTKNCQHFAKTLALFARGILKQEKVDSLLHDKNDPMRLTWHFIYQCTVTSLIELINVVLKYFQKQ